MRGNLEGARGRGGLSGAVVCAGRRHVCTCSTRIAHGGKIAGLHAGYEVRSAGILLTALLIATGEERRDSAQGEDAEDSACLTAGEGSAAMVILRKGANLLANLFHACFLPPRKNTLI